MNGARAEAAGIIRNDWGDDPKFGMARNLNIWNRLVARDGPELVNGAMSVLFSVAPHLERPVTLRIFYSGATTSLYERCKARWIEHPPDGEVSLPTVELPGMPTAGDDYRRRENTKRESLRRFAKARNDDR